MALIDSVHKPSFLIRIDSQYSSQQLTFVWSLKHHISQPFNIFNRRVLHLDRLKEGTWLHSFGIMRYWPSSFHYKMANQFVMKNRIKTYSFLFTKHEWTLLVSLSTTCFFSSSISFRIAGLIDLGAGVGVTDFIRIDFNFIWDSSSL